MGYHRPKWVLPGSYGVKWGHFRSNLVVTWLGLWWSWRLFWWSLFLLKYKFWAWAIYDHFMVFNTDFEFTRIVTIGINQLAQWFYFETQLKFTSARSSNDKTVPWKDQHILQAQVKWLFLWNRNRRKVPMVDDLLPKKNFLNGLKSDLILNQVIPRPI